MFDDVLERKKALLGSKMKKISRRIRIFPKILLTFFHVLIFGKIRTKNVFEDILERKRAFLDSKIRKLNKSKNQDFSKGVSPWFW